MVCVVLHEGGAAPSAATHDFQGAHQQRGLPVALGAEAVALGHEPLYGNPGKLAQTAQVLEIGRKGVKFTDFEERAQANFDLCGVS